MSRIEEETTRKRQEVLNFTFGNERASTNVTCLSPTDGDWSMRDLYEPEDVEKDPVLAKRLSESLARRNISECFGPSVASMSAIIEERKQLSTTIPLPGGIKLRRNRSRPSDGTFLYPHEGGVATAGGCPMLVAIGGGHVIFAHAGRDSLIDRVQARTKEPSRPHQSVVASIAEAFEGRGVSPRRVGVRAFFGVDHRAFGHPLHADHEGSEENHFIVEHIARQWPAWADRIVTIEDDVAYLSLRCLIQSETDRLGFRSFGYEKVLPINGAFGHTRHPDPKLKQARNLIIVHRTL